MNPNQQPQQSSTFEQMWNFAKQNPTNGASRAFVNRISSGDPEVMNMAKQAGYDLSSLVKKPTVPTQTQEQKPGFMQEAFGSAEPTGIVSGLVKGTVGSGGIGGIVGKPVTAAMTVGQEARSEESRGQLQQVTTALIKKASSLPVGSPQRQSLVDLIAENQKTLKISEEELANLKGTEETLGQHIGTTLSGMATVAGAASPATFAQKMLLSTGIGGAYGVSQAMQEKKPIGEVVKSGLLGAGTGAVAQGAMSGISALARYVTQKLPTSLTRNLLGQSSKELLAGKDATKLLLEDKRVGTFDGLVSKGNTYIDNLGNNISDILEKSGPTKNISPLSVAQEVADTINSNGGQTSASEVLNTVNKLAPQISGYLTNKSNDVLTTNVMRSGIDRTLGDGAFLSSQLPYSKFILREFADATRNAVKAAEPKTIPLFEEMSKEINLRDALLEQSVKLSKQPFLRLRDIIGATLGGFVGGLPGVGAGMVLEKAAQSAPAISGAAVGLQELGRLAPFMEKLTPAARLFILNTLTSASSPSVSTQPTQTK